MQFFNWTLKRLVNRETEKQRNRDLEERKGWRSYWTAVNSPKNGFPTHPPITYFFNESRQLRWQCVRPTIERSWVQILLVPHEIVIQRMICYLYQMCKRATTEMLMKYILALCLFKLYNKDFNPIEFTLLNFNQVLTGRQIPFITLKSNALRVGFNSLANRLYQINNTIPLSWLIMSVDMFKVNCKKQFLSF